MTLSFFTERSDAGLRSHLVRVKQGAMEAQLYIDKKTLRINSVSFMGYFGQIPRKGQIMTELSAYKTQEGVTFPSRTVMYFNGKKVMEEDVVSVKLGQVDEAKLKRPAQLAFGAPQEQAAPAHHAAWTRLTAPTAKLTTAITTAVKSLYGWATKNGIKPLPSSPTVHFIRTRGRKTTVEIRFPVVKPSQAVQGTRTMGLKAVKAQKLVWALQQGPYENSQKWLKALRKKLRKQRRRIIGNGGMQALTNPAEVTDPNQWLCAVFFVVRK